MQSTDEHGALDNNIEGAMLQQFTKHVGDAEPFPRIGPNSNGPPKRLAAPSNDPSLSSSSVVMSNTWSVNLAPEASSDARAPDAMRSSARTDRR